MEIKNNRGMNEMETKEKELFKYVENHCIRYYKKYQNLDDIKQAGYLAIYENIDKSKEDIIKKINCACKKESNFDNKKDTYNYDYNQIDLAFFR